MSIDIMNRIWWRSDLPTMEKFVALAIADAANDEGLAWPAVATIAEKCSCSPRTVQNATSGLCAKGLLRKRDRTDRSSFYIFNLDALPHINRVWRDKERMAVDGHERTGAGDSPQLFDTGESGSMTGESGSMTGAGDSPRIIIEPSLEPSASDSGDLKSPDVSLTNFVQAEWEALKADFPAIAGIRKIDDGLAHTIQLRAKQHGKPGEDPISVWRTVFEQIRASFFLTGQAPPGQGRSDPFKLTLGWLCKAEKFREVINGKYSSERGNRNRTVDRNGNQLGPTGQAIAGSVERLFAARQRG